MPTHSRTSIDVVLQTAADIDWETRRLCVITNVLFRNIGIQPVALSQIMLTVSPAPITEISGKVVAPQLVQVYGLHTKGKKQSGWKFDREDWFTAGRISGEYRIEPVQPLLLSPGMWLDMRDVHIECDIDRLANPLQVHAFVLADGKPFPATNPTSISFQSLYE